MGLMNEKLSELEQLLDREQVLAKELPAIIGRLDRFLEEKPKEVINSSLSLLQTRIEREASKGISGIAMVIIAPDLTISVNSTADIDSDHFVKRLRSEGCLVFTLEQFVNSMSDLRLQVAYEDCMPAIEFLKANAELRMP